MSQPHPQRLQKAEPRTSPKLLRDLQHGIESLMAGDLDAAEKGLRAVLARKRDHPVALHQIGLLFLRRAEPQRALKVIERAIAADPEQDGVWLSLANALEALGQKNDAIEACREAVARDAQDADGSFTLGRMLSQAGKLEEAEAVLRQTVRLAPNAPEAHDLLGQTLRLLKDLAGARRAFERAFQLQPEAPELRYRLGRGLLEENRPEQGRPLLESAAQALPDNFRVHRDLGRARLLGHDVEAAYASLTRALELEPNDAAAHVFLGWYYELRGDDEAMERHYRSGMELDPSITSPWYKLSRVGGTLTAGELMEKLDGFAGDGPAESNLHFALGEILRKGGEHARAFEHFAHGNRLSGVHHDRRVQSALARGAIQVCDENFFASRTDLGDASEAPVFIVGMPRSGTSLVEQVLAAHPAVHALGENSCVGDEVLGLRGRFGDEYRWPGGLERLDAEAIQGMAQRYWATVGREPEEIARFTDKAPGNYQLLGLIALMFPGARVVHVRRHPLDTIVSCFFTNFGANRCSSTYSLDDLTSCYRDYLDLMQHWREALPLAIHEIEYEALAQDLETGARELVEFCGLEWDPACLSFHDTGRVCFTASSHQVRQPVYTRSIGRWKHYAAELGGVIERLSAAGVALPGTDGPDAIGA
ncbi:MAG: tetratricopeptide repeat protein [bacterium]|nr:tetratricopeptide repeat protein [bacterium]